MRKLLIVNRLPAVVLASWLLVLGSMNSCKEVGPEIQLKENRNAVSDTTYLEAPVQAAETKNVLVEEFTGVRCPNCPQGHDILENIKAANPGRVFSVSLHPLNSLSRAYSFSKDTFENTQADALYNYLGNQGFQPAAAIDRKIAGTATELFDKNAWNTNVTSQLAQATPVNIKLDKSYNAATRELTIITELHYTQPVTEKNKLTVILTESDIISAQLNGSDIDTFYIHNDVQRAFITGLQGDLVDEELVAGRVVIKVFKITLLNKWKPENLHILAFVHQFENAKLVYQAKEIEVQ